MPELPRDESRRRAIIIRCMLQIREAWVAEEKFVDSTWIMMAIHLGAIEGRPLDISSIAELTHVPRPTVQRHLSRLKKQGRVEIVREGRRSVALVGAHDPGNDFFAILARAIMKAANDLSELGS